MIFPSDDLTLVQLLTKNSLRNKIQSKITNHQVKINFLSVQHGAVNKKEDVKSCCLIQLTEMETNKLYGWLL